jgi:hypothetical protein
MTWGCYGVKKILQECNPSPVLAANITLLAGSFLCLFSILPKLIIGNLNRPIWERFLLSEVWVIH